MTIEDAMFQFISTQPRILALVPKNRIYRVEIPQNSPYPVIVIHRIDAIHDLVQEGMNRMASARLQLSSFSTKNDAESRKIADEIKLATHGYRGVWGTVRILRAAVETDLGATYDDISQTFQTVIDVMTMFHEQDPS
jgi:hypothetical protein